MRMLKKMTKKDIVLFIIAIFGICFFCAPVFAYDAIKCQTDCEIYLEDTCEVSDPPTADNIECMNTFSSDCLTEVEFCKTVVPANPATPAAGAAGAAGTGFELVNPIGGTNAEPQGITDIPTLIGKIISVALGIMGSLALVFFLYGGFLWLTSRGKQSSIETGTKTITWAVIGIVLVFSSYVILRFIMKALGVV